MNALPMLGLAALALPAALIQTTQDDYTSGGGTPGAEERLEDAEILRRLVVKAVDEPNPTDGFFLGGGMRQDATRLDPNLTTRLDFAGTVAEWSGVGARVNVQSSEAYYAAGVGAVITLHVHLPMSAQERETDLTEPDPVETDEWELERRSMQQAPLLGDLPILSGVRAGGPKPQAVDWTLSPDKRRAAEEAIVDVLVKHSARLRLGNDEGVLVLMRLKGQASPATQGQMSTLTSFFNEAQARKKTSHQTSILVPARLLADHARTRLDRQTFSRGLVVQRL